ncbi:Fe-S oxidoreductase [Desulfitobacterium dehalogenans ATCC 51507]|uniref:Fe-S oxidoreductase n=1 Tax=Desulfitobacterium dehalogenans (strain ATCC 51507 / DSM 9161 / JW/IU-DC1) TaxID=756499 RepID=I4AEB6_DESDJ|nr:B12-binding domain-containing radical SAM protein [Desulfitobacterium dehalogenans]AFM02301.1 Fe-S oxidoreductase [Desulfitobacterium dehalogenans ATCC 51507]
MRILLVALNAKYVHTNLAIRYLRESVRGEFPDVDLREFTINEPIERIAAEIYEVKADVIGFSCYIWNLKETLAVIRQLRPTSPHTRILVGGPEVSFEAEAFLRENPEIDGAVLGEGEITFLELMRAWESGSEPSQVQGLAWRSSTQEIVLNPPRQQIAMAELPNPYNHKEELQGRLAYVETTRGCPFNCQYCLSSTFQGVRYLPAERFREILRQTLQCGARTIKLVDRTFNVDKEHSFKILDIAREEAAHYPSEAGIRIHCEIAGELLDEDWLHYLQDYPKDLVQFEIGVQSTNPETLAIICRPQHFERWAKYVREIRSMSKAHLHLDLIAGLPKEGWDSFRGSFNEVYAVQPDMLQLGFLKVLKGSGLRKKSKEYGLVFSPDPPYTVLQTDDLSHDELLKLHRLEDILDRYYNSGRFGHTLDWAIGRYSTPFDFYHEFAEYWHQQGWFRQSWSAKALFEKLWAFFAYQSFRSDICAPLRERLRLDYYLWERPNSVPAYLLLPDENLPPNYPEIKYSFQQDPRWAHIIPEFRGMDRRQWTRATAVEYFQEPQPQWVLFFYQNGRTQTYPIRTD